MDKIALVSLVLSPRDKLRQSILGGRIKAVTLSDVNLYVLATRPTACAVDLNFVLVTTI